MTKTDDPDDPARITPAGNSDPDGTVRRVVTVENSRGLHARAAAKFVKLAATFEAEIRVMRSDMTVSGLSIMGIMMLAAGPGTEIELSASGVQAGAAIDALVELIGRKFDED